jgi:RimJ/RimL family protein N-acetyltransferase
MVDEALFARRINSDLVPVQRCRVPARTVLTGRDIRLEPLDPVRHTPALYQAGHRSEAARSSWDFLPWGPFPSEQAMASQMQDFAAALDRVFYAFCDPVTGQAVGMATYLDIQPKAGVIEIGAIWFAPDVARTRRATESLFLMLCYADG